MAITYRSAGVDRDAAAGWVDRAREAAATTSGRDVVAGIGGFSALVNIPIGRFTDPVLSLAVDGVGTKVALALAAGRLEGIGVDLVAMCVNDVITSGAEPLAFLDQLSTSRLDVERFSPVLKGIAEGCRRAGCAFVGGETAQLPGFFRDDRFELAGFAAGVVERARLVDGSKVRAGDRVIGVASSGVHANGFSLITRILGDAAPDPETLERLLAPTHIYAGFVKTVQAQAFAHVTGGGLPGNLPRVLPKGLGARVSPSKWPEPEIFAWLRSLGGVDEDELRQTFNLGLGFVAVVAPDAAAACIDAAAAAGFEAWDVGEIVEGRTGVEYA